MKLGRTNVSRPAIFAGFVSAGFTAALAVEAAIPGVIDVLA
jgi:hypothetical protein